MVAATRNRSTRRKAGGIVCLAATLVAFAPLCWAAIQVPTATPATITFTANDPDNPAVGGSVSATISFRVTGGATARTWNVQVQATSANFSSCPSSVPVSQVTATCASVVVGGNATGTCSGPVNLSTGLQTVASGNEGSGTVTYTVVVNYKFTDSWRFIPTGSACSLGLSYLITAN
jgi:hypothetical protein